MSIRYFRVDADGSLARVSQAQMWRWWRNEEPLPAPLAAGGELKYLEVAVETEGSQVTRVLRVVAHRHAVESNGTIDRRAAVARAMERVRLTLDLYGERSEADEIRQLEADANAFWWPTDAQLEMLGIRLFRERLTAAQLADLRTKVFKPGHIPADY